MAVEDRLHAVVDPIIDDLELELVDLVYAGGRLKITIDHPDGLDTEKLTKATRLISHEMDLAEPIGGSYTLEVTSPGVERPLRTPAHYFRSIGEQVSFKLVPSNDLRRIKGTLTAADEHSATVDVDGESHTIVYDDIAKAKTVFDWGPAPKPGKSKKQPAGKNAAGKTGSNQTTSNKTSSNKKQPANKPANKNTAPKNTANKNSKEGSES